MINYELVVPDNIKHLSDWKEFDSLLPRGKVIVNKSICGCGFTVAYLVNDMPVILVSPRRELINSKMKDDNLHNLFYFDRSKAGSKVSDTKKSLINYLTLCCQNKTMPKILVTYDSLKVLLDQLVQSGDLKWFTIVVDEFPCIFTDAKLKGNVELTMIRHLSTLNNHVIFVSATPIKDIYLDATPEFMNVPIYTLIWPPQRFRTIHLDHQTMRSTREACGRVISFYMQNGYFKQTIVNGQMVYSTEALFFLNNVKDIVGIIKDFGLTSDMVKVICAEGNEAKLAEIGFCIEHAASKKDYKTENKPFTFITKASFEGTDFYSDNASSYIFADPGITSLGLDISIDLPQIAGRCRTEDNPFRNEITYFYKTSLDNDIQKLENDINERIKETQLLLNSYANITDARLLRKLAIAQKAEKYKSDYTDVIYKYDDTGEEVASLEENIYAKLADLRGVELLKSQYKTNYNVFVNLQNNGFSVANPLGGSHGYELRAFCTEFFKDSNFMRRMALYVDFMTQRPMLKNDVEAIPQIPMDYKLYYDSLPVDRIKALNYRKSAIEAEFSAKQSFAKIQSALAQVLVPGNSYASSELKVIIQKVYDRLSVKKTAKATDIERYCPSAKSTTVTTPDGRKKGYKI